MKRHTPSGSSHTQISPEMRANFAKDDDVPYHIMHQCTRRSFVYERDVHSTERGRRRRSAAATTADGRENAGKGEGKGGKGTMREEEGPEGAY